MTKEKLYSLTVYRNELKGKLESEVPEKHITHPKSYKTFLLNELSVVEAKLDEAKLEGAAK